MCVCVCVCVHASSLASNQPKSVTNFVIFSPPFSTIHLRSSEAVSGERGNQVELWPTGKKNNTAPLCRDRVLVLELGWECCCTLYNQVHWKKRVIVRKSKICTTATTTRCEVIISEQCGSRDFEQHKKKSIQVVSESWKKKKKSLLFACGLQRGVPF